MADGERASGTLVETLRGELTRGALPGETEGFTPAEQEEAAAFLAAVAARRQPGEVLIRLESRGGADATMRRMRLAIVNNDIARAREESEGFGLFVWSLIGLDRTAATEAFSKFLADTTYTAAQIHFIGLIVEHLTENGLIRLDLEDVFLRLIDAKERAA